MDLLLLLLLLPPSLGLYTMPPLASSPPAALQTTPQSKCNLRVDPPTLVVRFGDPVWVNCSNTEVTMMGWNGLQRECVSMASSLLWTEEALRSWSLDPVCFALTEVGPCQVSVQLLVYQAPEAVSIRFREGPLVQDLTEDPSGPLVQELTEDPSGPLVQDLTEDPSGPLVQDLTEDPSGPLVQDLTEDPSGPLVQDLTEDPSGPLVQELVQGRLYSLQCEVRAGAPAQSLRVRFFRGLQELGAQNSTSGAPGPVDLSFSLVHSVSREDHGALFWCEVTLQLGPQGPQPPPVVRSSNITASVLLREDQVEAPPTLPAQVHDGRPTVQSQRGQRRRQEEAEPRGAGPAPGSSALVPLALLLFQV